ncbi:hypothetical protein B0A48_11652 [Cryoendolithus antarcticus]|uniref:TRIP4/RQT4 C2HC5-type zinc finger domain-containing protein n=1 Tax=Cryoendolithus antarcticus TaxID=1507870 RepID=A0A1V8SSQ6_9PEZI|nr:hypothetical protein B0A48_11652 [Cryoendolithus antarcticus]
MAADLSTWALPRLQKLLPLDEESLKQVVTYTDTLPKDAAADHLKNMLGDSAQAFEFISAFNQRRQRPPNEAKLAPPRSVAGTPRPASPALGFEVPKGKPRQQRKKPNIHALPPRQVGAQDLNGAAYKKRDEGDYMPQQARQQRHKDQVADNLALREKPDATQMPLITDSAQLTSKPIASKPPPSAAGLLVSDALAPPARKGSAPSSRTASPAAKTKINISGGTAMHGASTALSDLDSAIRVLEVQTNPSLASDSAADLKKRQCNCMATRHPLLDIAPNCTNCGKVICVKQGLGPCTFCNTPLLSPDEITKVLRVLKDERGEERMKANNATQKRADVAIGKPRAFTGRDFIASTSARPSPLSSAPTSDVESDSADTKAKAHRDRLLTYQANNARRTQVHDEAADYDLPTAGTNMWASPQERAQQLKKQQKVMRETEWNARPEYEKRQVVASIDLQGRRMVKKMVDKERPNFEGDDEPEADYVAPQSKAGEGKGFSNNPLLGTLVRPKAREERSKGAVREKGTTWRRVQMDDDDNEAWLLDGGAYGERIEGRMFGEEEHAFG